jgi:hypothetical protein
VLFNLDSFQKSTYLLPDNLTSSHTHLHPHPSLPTRPLHLLNPFVTSPLILMTSATSPTRMAFHLPTRKVLTGLNCSETARSHLSPSSPEGNVKGLVAAFESKRSSHISQLALLSSHSVKAVSQPRIINENDLSIESESKTSPPKVNLQTLMETQYVDQQSHFSTTQHSPATSTSSSSSSHAIQSSLPSVSTSSSSLEENYFPFSKPSLDLTSKHTSNPIPSNSSSTPNPETNQFNYGLQDEDFMKVEFDSRGRMVVGERSIPPKTKRTPSKLRKRRDSTVSRSAENRRSSLMSSPDASQVS